jgi:hypothetical protein
MTGIIISHTVSVLGLINEDANPWAIDRSLSNMILNFL